jgi:pimeloyl-ACP methyl ester carboxylesterase
MHSHRILAPAAASARRPALVRRSRSLCAVGLLLACVIPAGCQSAQLVSVRDTPAVPLMSQLNFASSSGPKPTQRTLQTLRKFGLEEMALGQPAEALAQLEKFMQQEPELDTIIAYGELSYLAGKLVEKHDEAAALDYYGASAAHAYVYLFDPRFGFVRNPYDPSFRGACDLYNGALEGALRIVKKQGVLQPGCQHVVHSSTQAWNVEVVMPNSQWHQDEFDRFEFVSDHELTGLKNHHRTYGLGVPLIAVRKRGDHSDPCERFYPPNLSFPVTAFLRVVSDNDSPPAAGNMSRNKVLIELHDPFRSTDINVAGVRIPLESDQSTPLAYFLDDVKLDELATVGLLNPDTTQSLTGLYMLQAYDPNKIPVVMVHGLWSSPMTWIEMFNDLQSDPQIRDRYQIWFFMYPTGQPLWASAADCRESLAAVRQTVDPRHENPALDEMVMIGHSMGGLVSRLQTVESGNEYWNAISERPFDTIEVDDEDRQRLAKTFFFQPDRSIRRVITIGTPHRGSTYANSVTRWLGRHLIALPNTLMAGTQRLIQRNPGVFRDGNWQGGTSIDSLAPDSPLLALTVAAPRPSWVNDHNIVGTTEPTNPFAGDAPQSDGVVEFTSGHLDNAASELVVSAGHSDVHRHPLAILEVRRILLEHLSSLQNAQQHPPHWNEAHIGPVPPLR